MVDSQSLRLALGAASVQDQIAAYIAQQLRAKGYDISPATLNFLSALDCGVNVGADIARRLKVSRQMVAKTVKELCHAGYLEQVDGVGKQKQILFTAAGEQLMAEVRQLLAQLDTVLLETLGETALQEILTQLETIQSLLSAS